LSKTGIPIAFLPTGQHPDYHRATLVKDMKLAKDQNWGQITPVLAPLPGMPY
jgi:hypothetical protein